ncbi:hypothetical protein HanIR_Chr16g0802021 [Helianthus annuus]|nr:hypothetical protein HanIR_Chr16g0802021 [Helianthus annuus]
MYVISEGQEREGVPEGVGVGGEDAGGISGSPSGSLCLFFQASHFGFRQTDRERERENEYLKVETRAYIYICVNSQRGAGVSPLLSSKVYIFLFVLYHLFISFHVFVSNMLYKILFSLL